MIEFSTDPCKNVTLHFRINRDGLATFDFGTLNLSTYTVVVNFKYRKNDTTNVLQLTSGSGLTVGTFTVAMAMSKSNSVLFTERTFFWEMVRTKTSLEKDWFTGDAIFHYGKFDLGTTAQTVTLLESGSSVTVAIS